MKTIYNDSFDDIYYDDDFFGEISTSNQIKEIQLFLKSKGYNIGRWGADGKLGNYTNQAIYDYIIAQSTLGAGGAIIGGTSGAAVGVSSNSNAITANLKSVFTRKNYIFQEGELRLNIIGIRNLNANANYFDDELIVIWKENGINNVKRFPITTDPGKGYLSDRMINPKGTAIIKPGQYRNAYELGYHRGKYMALVQRSGPVTVYRDNNRNGTLDFMIGNQDTGYFGINIHKAGVNSSQVNRWSAGCQVFKRQADFNSFLELCKKSDRKYGPGAKFTYTVLEKRGTSIV